MLKRVIDGLFILGLLTIAAVYIGYFKFFKKEYPGLPLKDFQPRSNLVVEQHPVTRAKFPVFDAHIHLDYSGLTAEQVVQIMDSCNVYKLVNLETHGWWGEKLKEMIDRYQAKYPDRFITVANLDYSGIDEPDFPQKAVAQLEEAYKMGARALKVWRNLGLMVRDSKGKLVRIDDPRLDGVWERAGELKMPVIMHIADPTAFWKPVDEHNERYEELQAHLTKKAQKWTMFGPRFDALTGTWYKISLIRHPERLYYHSDFNWSGDYYPTKEELIAQRDRVIARHPNTLFIGAHMGYQADDLAFVAKELDRFPNYYVELSHVVNELGRQPFTARKFFIKYQDRILFGLDGKTETDAYAASFRFLETRDEYFDYPRYHWNRFGRWKIYGIFLPDSVLKKIYAENAEKVFSYRALSHSVQSKNR